MMGMRRTRPRRRSRCTQRSQPWPPFVPSWPRVLRQVRIWLDPWICLWRWWHAWSDQPPPAELQALLDWLGNGHPLHYYVRA